MIILIIAAWWLCGVICYGAIGHLYPDEVVDMDDKILWMFLSMTTWPTLAAFCGGVYVLKKFVKLGEFVTGFMDSVHKGKKNEKR